MAEKKKQWDLTSTHSLEGAALWVRGRARAKVVLVIREDDWAVDADPALLPQDVVAAVRDVLPVLYQMMLQRKVKQ
jgi:uncharacterized protein (UPF0216 family)